MENDRPSTRVTKWEDFFWTAFTWVFERWIQNELHMLNAKQAWPIEQWQDIPWAASFCWTVRFFFSGKPMEILAKETRGKGYEKKKSDNLLYSVWPCKSQGIMFDNYDMSFVRHSVAQDSFAQISTRLCTYASATFLSDRFTIHSQGRGIQRYLVHRQKGLKPEQLLPFVFACFHILSNVRNPGESIAKPCVLKNVLNSVANGLVSTSIGIPKRIFYRTSINPLLFSDVFEFVLFFIYHN